MDAVFLVDTEYPTFQSAWEDLTKLVGLSGSTDKTTVEPLRFTLKGAVADEWLSRAKIPPDEIGWHFSIPSGQLQMLTDQSEKLVQHRIPHEVRSSSVGNPQQIAYRYSLNNAPAIVIPFEDAVKHTAKFFGKYVPAFSKQYGWSRSKADANFRRFVDQCEKTFPNEKPVTFESGGFFARFSTSLPKHVWSPKFGKVGRHDIFTELRIMEEPIDIGALISLLSALEQLGRPGPIHLYIQFFLPVSRKELLVLPKSALYEMTFVFPTMTFERTSGLLENLDIRDVSMVLEQAEAKLGYDCQATYTFRKTPMRGYEIRLNAVWKNDTVDPEHLVANAERKSGLTLSRIV